MRKLALIPVVLGVILLLVAFPISAQKSGVAPSISSVDHYAIKTPAVLKEKYSQYPNEKQYATLNIRNERDEISTNAFDEVKNALPKDSVKNKFDNHALIVQLSKSELETLLNNKYNLVHSIEAGEESTHELVLDEIAVTIDALEVWATPFDTGYADGAGQTVCVIDSGVDFTHPALAGKNIAGCNYNCAVPATACFLDCSITDENGHGTAVAGAVASIGAPYQGIAKGANIISMRVTPPGSGGTATTNAMGTAMLGCRNLGVDVISISVGTLDTYTNVECQTAIPSHNTIVNTIVNTNGIPIVAAAGNQGVAGETVSPSCVDNAIAVGGVTDTDTLWVLSNYDDETLLFAQSLFVTGPAMGGGYGTSAGTSIATPQVSGAIAILRQIDEGAGNTHTPAQYEQILFDGGEAVIGLPFAEHRRINVANAVFSLERDFKRGDVNNDGVHDISDPVRILSYLFGNSGGTPVPVMACHDSADSNDDGNVNIADVVYMLSYLFEGGPQMPAPFGTVGDDVTGSDVLRCF